MFTNSINGGFSSDLHFLSLEGVAILPSGQVVIAFPDRSPATMDLAYLSLDSIAYQISDTPGPHALTLTRSGEVLAVLHKPRHLRLIVFALGRKAHLVGTVALGSAPAGRSRFAWNLRVAGGRLPAGTYTGSSGFSQRPAPRCLSCPPALRLAPSLADNSFALARA